VLIVRNSELSASASARIIDGVESRLMARVDSSVRRRRVAIGLGKLVGTVAVATSVVFAATAQPGLGTTTVAELPVAEEGTVSLDCIALPGETAATSVEYSAQLQPTTLSEAAAACNMVPLFSAQPASEESLTQDVAVLSLQSSARLACRAESRSPGMPRGVAHLRIQRRRRARERLHIWRGAAFERGGRSNPFDYLDSSV